MYEEAYLRQVILEGFIDTKHDGEVELTVKIGVMPEGDPEGSYECEVSWSSEVFPGPAEVLQANGFTVSPLGGARRCLCVRNVTAVIALVRTIFARATFTATIWDFDDSSSYSISFTELGGGKVHIARLFPEPFREGELASDEFIEQVTFRTTRCDPTSVKLDDAEGNICLTLTPKGAKNVVETFNMFFRLYKAYAPERG
jgi:hypothetical protein